MSNFITSQQQIGSMTAKGGFENERDIVKKFRNFTVDKDVRQWLAIMGYDVTKVQSLTAKQIPTKLSKTTAKKYGITEDLFEFTQKFKKADIQIQLSITIDDIIYRENISLKKANTNANFNQIDKRSVDIYQQMWQFNNDIACTLKKFTGAIVPDDTIAHKLRDKRRWYLNELPQAEVEALLSFLRKNQTLIFSDILKGRGMLAAEWFLVTRKNQLGEIDWILKNINEVINFYAQGDITVSSRGSLILGRLTAQRKGGTPDPTSLQFKIKPNDLFAN